MADYFELPGLEHLYLEDSFLLAVRDGESDIRFELEAVLTELHPLWHEPQAGEQYCYRRIDLAFTDIRQASWLERQPVRSVDADGSVDYGNIDHFTWEPGRYELSGDGWHVEIFAGQPPEAVLHG